MDNAGNLKNSLEKFCKLSGELINTQKSYTVFGRNTPKKFVRLLNKGFKVANKEKLGKTISSSQFSSLSQAGKLLLKNSILIAFASHVMATDMIPKKILRQATSAILKFWWSSSMEKKPIYWKNIVY